MWYCNLDFPFSCCGMVGSMHSDWVNLQKERLRAMEVKDTLERLGNSLDFVKNNISAVAAKLALQSLKMQ